MAKDFIICIDFEEQTPKMLLEAQKSDTLYEMAFLSGATDDCGKYGQNTACWD